MNEEAQTAERVGAGGETPNLVQRVVMAFSSPTRLGEVLRQRSPWFWTLAIVAIIGTITVLVIPEELFQQMTTAARGGQAQGQAEPSIGMMRGIGAGSALLGSFVAAAVIAGVLYLVFNVIYGRAEATYKQHMSALAHSWWILMIGNLITVALQVAKGDGTLRLGFGLLLAEDPSSFVGHFLNGITIFGLWSSAALGAVESGLSGGKVSVGKAATTVIVLYLAFVAVSAIFPSLAG
jgi:hypothetical protein